MLTTITPAAGEPVTLAEARLQTRASSAEDALLSLCIAAARAKCEGELQRALITRTVDQTFADLASPLRLWLMPLGEVTSVRYLPEVGTQQTLAQSAYVVRNDGVHADLLPAAGVVWPTVLDHPSAVTVRYTAGYGATAADVPADIRAWLLLTIGYLYVQREAFDATGRAADIPSRFCDALLDPYRRYGRAA